VNHCYTVDLPDAGAALWPPPSLTSKSLSSPQTPDPVSSRDGTVGVQPTKATDGASMVFDDYDDDDPEEEDKMPLFEHQPLSDRCFLYDSFIIILLHLSLLYMHSQVFL